VPVQLLRSLIDVHGFSGSDIRTVTIEVSNKVVSHHGERAPSDIMQAQYSVPFCVAIAAYHDPLDPGVFTDRILHDARVRDLTERIRLSASEAISGWGARVSVGLNDGRTLGGQIDTWLGCPETPLATEQLRVKFDRLVQTASARLRESLFDDLMRVERYSSLEALYLA